MTHKDDDRPMADRRDLTVKERQRLQRERAGTLPVAKKMDVPPSARRVLMMVVAQGGLHAKKVEADPKLLKALRGLQERGLARLAPSRKGREMWHATDDGRGWVSATGLLPVFLHRRSEFGVTHSAAQGLVNAGEDMRPQSDRPNMAA